MCERERERERERESYNLLNNPLIIPLISDHCTKVEDQIVLIEEIPNTMRVDPGDKRW